MCLCHPDFSSPLHLTDVSGPCHSPCIPGCYRGFFLALILCAQPCWLRQSGLDHRAREMLPDCTAVDSVAQGFTTNRSPTKVTVFRCCQIMRLHPHFPFKEVCRMHCKHNSQRLRFVPKREVPNQGTENRGVTGICQYI